MLRERAEDVGGDGLPDGNFEHAILRQFRRLARDSHLVLPGTERKLELGETAAIPGESAGRCASDSYKMDLSANIVQTGTILSGNWFESEYRQGGKISGEHENGIVNAKIESDTITALLTMRTKGNHQLFAMESPGAWISQVSIQLIKDPK